MCIWEVCINISKFSSKFVVPAVHSGCHFGVAPESISFERAAVGQLISSGIRIVRCFGEAMVLGKPKPRSSCRLWAGFLLVFALSCLLQVEGRPYREKTKSTHCSSLSLTSPTEEFLSKIVSKLSLVKELKAKTLLTAKNESSFPWNNWRLCEASGFGIVRRDTANAEGLVMNCKGLLVDDDRSSPSIDGAAVVYSFEDTWNHVSV